MNSDVQKKLSDEIREIFAPIDGEPFSLFTLYNVMMALVKLHGTDISPTRVILDIIQTGRELAASHNREFAESALALAVEMIRELEPISLLSRIDDPGYKEIFAGHAKVDSDE